MLGRKASTKLGAPKHGPANHGHPNGHANGHQRPNGRDNQQTFSKVFRWLPPEGVKTQPGRVEIIGSCTHWQRVPLERDTKVGAWHATVHHIPGNRTHHYMLLVDGQPTFDHNCDGYAVPRGFEEEQYALATERGPRVLMLFAQTK